MNELMSFQKKMSEKSLEVHIFYVDLEVLDTC